MAENILFIDPFELLSHKSAPTFVEVDARIGRIFFISTLRCVTTVELKLASLTGDETVGGIFLDSLILQPKYLLNTK